MWLAFRLLSPKYPLTRAGLPIVRPQSFSQLAWLRCAGMLSYCLLMAVKVVEGVVGGSSPAALRTAVVHAAATGNGIPGHAPQL